jgi:hypothetical protein
VLDTYPFSLKHITKLEHYVNQELADHREVYLPVLITDENKRLIKQMLLAAALGSLTVKAEWGNLESWTKWPPEKCFGAMKYCFDSSRIAMCDHNAMLNAISDLKLSFNPSHPYCMRDLMTSFTAPLEKALDDYPDLADNHKVYIAKLEKKFVGKYLQFVWEDICKNDPDMDYEGGIPSSIPILISRLITCASREHLACRHGIKRGYHEMISETQVAALSSSKEEAPQYEEIDDRLNVLGGSKAKKNKKVVSKPSLPNKETPRQKCNGCGKAHKDTRCGWKNHPDFNCEDKPFIESTKGKAWKARYGLDNLQFGLKSLSGDDFSSFADKLDDIVIRRRYNGNKCKHSCDHCVINLLNNKYLTSHPSLIPCRMECKASVREIVSLLDTGALHANYIGLHVRDWLIQKGAEEQHVTKRVCSAMNQCSSSSSMITINLRFFEPNLAITLQAYVLETPYDIIIGTPTIRKHELLKVFGDRFQREPTIDVAQLSCSPNSMRVQQASCREHCVCASCEVHTIAAAIETLQGSNIKHKSDLIDYEPDTYEYEFDQPYAITWDKESQKEASDSSKEKNQDPLDLIKIEGSEQLKLHLRSLCEEFREIFRQEVKPTPASVTPITFDVDKVKWDRPVNRRPARPVSVTVRNEIQRQIGQMLANNVIRPSQASSWSQVLMVKKPNGKYRFCIDYRNFNQCIKKYGWPIPNIPSLLRRIGEHHPKFYGVMDLTSGYHQAPIDESSREATAFITWMGLFEWNRLPMGPMTGPSYFQGVMAYEVLAGLIYTILELYMDDLIVFAKTETEYLSRIRMIFQRLQDHNITVNPEKCILGKIEYTGYVLDNEGISFSKEKIASVINFRKPETHKELKSFLGMVTYFHTHIKNHSMLCQPLHETIRINNYLMLNKSLSMLVTEKFLKENYILK